ncbi:uncharacterized protein IL334_005208 [Kwoniella shivajii]|uniref:Major facilitator superfamily (MFS) profile domain-containing protein n=1 Tax=Kwoniella shivajii TaxID=564305 RepID=A0ABZ1D6F9_9TREE|nr:hypothetical protein IL334_005208 [Kwoniella shivajii]
MQMLLQNDGHDPVDVDSKPEQLFREDAADNDQYAPEYLSWSLFTTIKQFWRAMLYCFIVSLGAMYDGFAVSVPGSIIAHPAFIKQFGSVISAAGVLELDALHVSAWSACQNGGQIFGMLSGPSFSDWFGRKAAMWGLAILLIIGTVLEIVAKDWRVYAVGKFLIGMGTGMVQSGLTVYIAEVAPVRSRGAVLSFYSLAFALGQLASAVGLQIIATKSQYRNIFYSEFIFLALFIPALVFAPESPSWCIRKGQTDRAKKSIRLLYGNVPSLDVEKEYNMLKLTVDEESKGKSDKVWREYLECFQGSDLRRTWVSFLPLAYQQFVGIALFFGYTSYFFQLAGYPRPFEASLIQSCILLLFLLISFFVIDKIGRRPLVLVGGAIMCICSYSVGGIGFMATLPGTALVSLTCVWTAAYALSVGCVGWAYVAETSSPRLRAKTTGMAAAGTAAFGLIFQYCVPLMLSPQKANWGLKIGLFFGSVSIFGWIVVYFFVPETKGRTYPELDELFEKKIPSRQFASYVTEVQSAASARATNRTE